jgi:methylmalonyl-CoA mutase N-terminal domain/subunit
LEKAFFFNAHNDLFEEVKFRAARRMWAQIMKELGHTQHDAPVSHKRAVL